MSSHYLVRTADNVIVAGFTEASAGAGPPTPPSGFAYYTYAAVAGAAGNTAIFQGGTFDGTTYAAPASQLPDMTPLGMMRSAARAMHRQLLDWATQLQIEGMGHPADQVALGHTYLARAHEGAYLVLHNHRQATDSSGNALADWTVAQRTTFCNQMGQGAADVDSPFAFFTAMQMAGGLIDTPTGPVVWVNPSTGSRVDLERAVEETRSEVYLDASMLPASSIISGDWIDAIAA